MFSFKLTSLLVLMNCVIKRSNCVPDKEENKLVNCAIQRKCSTNEDIAWATDNKQCYLFRNPCIFANEMCMRRNKNLDEFKIVTQDECKEYCQDFCTEEYAPVCGEYDNDYKTFSNECDFYRHSCHNSKSYILLQNSACDQDALA